MAHFLPSWYKFYWVLARSRKFDRSHEVIPSYKIGGVHWRSVAVQVASEPEIRQGTEFKLRADARFDSRSFSEGWCPGTKTITNLS